MSVTGRIDRKYMAHYIDTSFGGTESWYRLGKYLEEYSVDLNPDASVVKNILGSTYFQHNGYEPSASAEPFYAEVGDALFTQLQDIVDTLATGDDLLTSMVEVHLWDGNETSGYAAIKQDCYIVPSSYGGDTSGYQIPFTVNYVGDKTEGTFVPNSSGGGTFTAAS